MASELDNYKTWKHDAFDSERSGVKYFNGEIMVKDKILDIVEAKRLLSEQLSMSSEMSDLERRLKELKERRHKNNHHLCQVGYHQMEWTMAGNGCMECKYCTACW